MSLPAQAAAQCGESVPDDSHVSQYVEPTPCGPQGGGGGGSSSGGGGGATPAPADGGAGSAPSPAPAGVAAAPAPSSDSPAPGGSAELQGSQAADGSEGSKNGSSGKSERRKETGGIDSLRSLEGPIPASPLADRSDSTAAGLVAEQLGAEGGFPLTLVLAVVAVGGVAYAIGRRRVRGRAG